MSAAIFPNLPYSELRDDRPPRLVDRQKVVSIVDGAEIERHKVADENDVTDVEEYMLRHLSKDVRVTVSQDFFTKEDGSFFEEIDAYCDFEDGRAIRVTPEYFQTLIEADPTNTLWHDVRETFAHEFGHLKNKGHKRALTMRAKKERHSLRAARSRDLYNSNDEFSATARHLDLEQEADIFAYAFLVPIKKLNGTLSLRKLSELYQVSPRVAYQAALLAKEYCRNSFLLSRRKKHATH